MQPELAGVDAREEVAPDERVQGERREREPEEHGEDHRPVLERPVESALVGAGQAMKTSFEGVGDPSEHRPPGRSTAGGLALLARPFLGS